MKVLENVSKMLKAHIWPHGNKDRDKFSRKTDSVTFSPVGVQVIQSIVGLFRWNHVGSVLLISTNWLAKDALLQSEQVSVHSKFQ